MKLQSGIYLMHVVYFILYYLGHAEKIQWIRALNYNVDSLGFKFFL